MECGTLVDSTVCPYAPAMAGDHALDQRQPDASAGKLFFAVQPLKHAEQLVGVCHVEPDAVVFDVVCQLGRTNVADRHRVPAGGNGDEGIGRDDASPGRGVVIGRLAPDPALTPVEDASRTAARAIAGDARRSSTEAASIADPIRRLDGQVLVAWRF